MDWLQALADANTRDIQMLRFWGAVINLLWLAPVGVLSILGREEERWPNGALAIPLCCIMAGLAGFSALVVWGFEPTANWRALLSLTITGGLVLFFAMGVARWFGVKL